MKLKKGLKILHLVLKSKWYDLIEQGIKLEEYREIKPYWCQRLQLCPCPYRYTGTSLDPGHHLGTNYCLIDNCPCPVTFDVYCKNYDIVCFHYGYTSRTMMFKIKSIGIGEGKPEWGAKTDTKYFVIKLGDKIDQEDEIFA